MMKYRIVKDASLRGSMRKFREKGDERWMLFNAILNSATYDEYMARVRGFEQEMISKNTGKPWLVTSQNFFSYVLRNERIAKS